MTDEVETWKVKKNFEMVREMGAPYVVEFFPWAYIENQKGEFDWQHADEMVDHARAQGLTVIARMGFVPPWARPPNTSVNYLDENHYSDFADFVAAFAEHYRGRVEHLIIWNEPNVSFEWGQRPVSPEEYTELLKRVYARVKQANPEVKILAGALAPNLAPPNSTDAMNDLEYLERMYRAGAADYFDILAVHSYGWKSPADESPSPDRVNFRRTELLRGIMEKYNDDDMPVSITEGGWNDHPRWTKAVTPAERIQNTLAAYDWCERTEWIQACALWVFRTPAPTYTFNDYFTFVTPEFDAKPIYLEVQEHARGE
jgi:beta-glucosidase/6-phospho-beta-glucosidase/beta-galactosidase